jgi:hypothetical protein
MFVECRCHEGSVTGMTQCHLLVLGFGLRSQMTSADRVLRIYLHFSHLSDHIGFRQRFTPVLEARVSLCNSHQTVRHTGLYRVVG